MPCHDTTLQFFILYFLSLLLIKIKYNMINIALLLQIKLRRCFLDKTYPALYRMYILQLRQQKSGLQLQIMAVL